MDDALQAVTMPKFGLSMTEGKVASWCVPEGHPVKAGQDLVEIETEKITNVYESPVEGIVRRHVLALDTMAPVGTLIGVVTSAEVSVEAIDSFIASFQATNGPETSDKGKDAAQVRTVDVDGMRIAYTESGSGHVALLVHGFSGDANNWLFNQEPLSRFCRVVALDLPGHGASSKAVADGSVGELARVVVSFMDKLQIDKAHLVGHSLGGAIAADIALASPSRVASLSLISPAGMGDEISGSILQDILDAERPKAVQKALEPLFANPDLITRQMVDNVLKAKRLDGAAEALAAIATANFAGGHQVRVFADRLRTLAVPVQIIWGADDRVIDASQAQRLEPPARVTILPGVGHMAHMEKPGEVNRLLADLIK